MDRVPFSYTNGPSGTVPAEALRTFQSKDRAVQDIMALPVGNAHHDEQRKRLTRRIHSANRRIRRNGWFFQQAGATE